MPQISLTCLLEHGIPALIFLAIAALCGWFQWRYRRAGIVESWHKGVAFWILASVGALFVAEAAYEISRLFQGRGLPSGVLIAVKAVVVLCSLALTALVIRNREILLSPTTRDPLAFKAPFEMLFYNAVTPAVIVSAGDERGDRLWQWKGEPLFGRWLLVNDAFQELVGYTLERLRYVTFKDITTPDTLDADVELLEAAVRDKEDGYQVSKAYIRSDGSVVPVRIYVSIAWDHENGTRIKPLYYVVHIVSEQYSQNRVKALEQELEALGGELNIARKSAQIIDQAYREQAKDIGGTLRDIKGLLKRGKPDHE